MLSTPGQPLFSLAFYVNRRVCYFITQCSSHRFVFACIYTHTVAIAHIHANTAASTQWRVRLGQTHSELLRLGWIKAPTHTVYHVDTFARSRVQSCYCAREYMLYVLLSWLFVVVALLVPMSAEKSIERYIAQSWAIVCPNRDRATNSVDRKGTTTSIHLQSSLCWMDETARTRKFWPGRKALTSTT